MLITLITILLALFVVFLIKSHNTRNIPTRRFCYGYALFGLSYAWTRIFFLFSDYESATHGGVATQLVLIYVVAAYSVTIFSFCFIFFSLEKYILIRKPVITISSIIGSCICGVALILTILGEGSSPSKIATYSVYVLGPIYGLGFGLSYIKIIKNTAGIVRRNAIISSIGLIIFFTGLLLDIDALSVLGIDSIRLLLTPILLLVGTIIWFLKPLDNVIVEYYQVKRICIVHRGVIEGKVFMCPVCSTFYCITCKDAIANAENKCWNCRAILDKSLRFDMVLKEGESSFTKFRKIQEKLNIGDAVETFKQIVRLSMKGFEAKVTQPTYVEVIDHDSL